MKIQGLALGVRFDILDLVYTCCHDVTRAIVAGERRNEHTSSDEGHPLSSSRKQSIHFRVNRSAELQ